tara:strand:- start:20503 stop:21066 length:564 start_codon:yes stop_codon:yes gene_type:complete
VPLAAQAHGFGAMDTPMQAVLSGAAALAAYPETGLPLIALGLWLAFCGGIARGGIALVAGLGAGILLAPFAPGAVSVLSLVAGTLVAAGTALIGPRLPGRAGPPIAALTTTMALASLLHGQGFDSLPVAFVAGVMGAALLAVILPSTLAGVVLRGGGAAWRALAVRIAASWLTAILVLVIAFGLRSA